MIDIRLITSLFHYLKARNHCIEAFLWMKTWLAPSKSPRVIWLLAKNARASTYINSTLSLKTRLWRKKLRRQSHAENIVSLTDATKIVAYLGNRMFSLTRIEFEWRQVSLGLPLAKTRTLKQQEPKERRKKQRALALSKQKTR